MATHEPNPNDPLGVLFICMGNICRSPLAEGVFLHMISERQLADRFLVDSAGTGNWHAGDPADPRTIAIGKKYGIAVPSIARQITDTDWQRFHYLLVMDHDNHQRVRRAGAPPERLHYLRSFDPELRHENDPQTLAVPDPYYGEHDGFDLVYHQVAAACNGLLETLIERHTLR